MSAKLRFLDRHICLVSLVFPLSFMLSACGGGGGDSHVASAPPPPLTPPTTQRPTIEVDKSWLITPATRKGNYDLIGRLSLTPGNGAPSSSRATTPSEFGLLVASLALPAENGFFYGLQGPSGVFPGGLTLTGVSVERTWTFNFPPAPSFAENDLGGDYLQFLGQRITASTRDPDGSETQFLSSDFTRGSRTTSQPLGATWLNSNLEYDIGDSYVAMGQWSWGVVDVNGTSAGDSGSLLFVNGDRTPASGIPVSGTATYDARSFALLSSGGTAGIPFNLTADFGQRTMATQISQDYQFNAANGAVDPILGIHVGGSAPFSNDSLNNTVFDIPLTGSVNYSAFNSPTTPPAESVSGTMNGGFFGPHAEQVGGVFAIGRPDGTLLMQDAFVGHQH